MEIKNNTCIDEKIFTEFQLLSGRLFKKSRTADLIFEIFLWIITALGISASLLVIVMEIFLGESEEIVTFAALILFLLFLSAIRIFTKIFMPKMMYKKSPIKGAVQNFTFKDDEFSAESKCETIQSTDILKYSSLLKVYETAGGMFLYISPYQALLVSKYGFASENDANAVREKLSALLGKKYITVK